MRDRILPTLQRPSNGPIPRLPFEQQLNPFEITRSFFPDQIDLDDLAEAIRLLLNPDEESDGGRGRDRDLLLPRRRASHVVGAKFPRLQDT